MNYDNKSERPSQRDLSSIPRGIEVLVKKASVDPEFRQLLLDRRAEAAREIDLELTEAEQNMLATIPAEQLEKIIDSANVKPEHLKIFLGRTAKLMLAAAAGVAVVSMMCMTTCTAGISPDRIREMQMKRAADANDVNEPNQVEPESDATEPNGAGKGK